MTIELEDQEALDTEAALAEISSELFGQVGNDGDSEKGQPEAGAEEAPSKPSEVEKPSSQPTEEVEKPSGETSAEVQEIGAPKTWSKEALADWATLPPRAQQEVLKREEDFLKGITMYKDRAETGDRYSKVVEPYAPILQSEGIDPVQLFHSFAANHYLLSRGTEQQKLELAANMISGYGIDFAKLINHIGESALEPVDPRVLALEKEIAELKQGQTSRQQVEQTQLADRLSTEIEAFASDPAHPYFPELVDDIAKLFETGQAATLPEAYEKAVFLNPATRQKEIDRLTAERTTSPSPEALAREAKIAKSTAADLSVTPRSKNGTVPIGSIDDTLAETLARITSRG